MSMIPASLPADSGQPAMSKRPAVLVDAPPASKRAAVVKRGAEREKRDLFAERDDDVSPPTSTDRPPPSFGFGGVGARNETSVLFRVDQLAGARIETPQATPAPVSDQRPGDDEGVIDLKALASTPPRPQGMPVAPLFSEPPPVTLEVEGGARPNAPPRSRLAIAFAVVAAAAVLAVAGFGISIAFRGEEPVKHAAAAVIVPPPPPPSAAPSAAPEPPPPATADDSDVKTKKKGKGKGSKGGGANKTPAAAKSAPPKPADPCGCHGDFNCILACTAHGGK
jgi:hypothetical protein